ncbi:MAG: glycosyltransferase [Paraclostridium sp.]
MKILILTTDYPHPNGYVSQYFIHTRNKEYVIKGLDISVLSFSAKEDYSIDGVNVFTYDTFKNKLVDIDYDILASHAPNIRQHYLFLNKYNKKFKRIVFFFHGHEVLKSSQIYPEPYSYMKKQSFIYKSFSDTYDDIKLKLWKKFFMKNTEKCEFVFVSNWMYDMFIKFVKLNPNKIKGKVHIVYNSIGKKFEDSSYDENTSKKYDFITIRNLLDKSKYCIDVVTNMAKNNPQYKFCVVGKGEFYKVNGKPENIEFIEKHLNHDEIISMLNKSKVALMPTKADAQGVMACEIATFGIPLITSDIDVCKEVFEGFRNVSYIDNYKDINVELLNLESIKTQGIEKNDKFMTINTIDKEIELFKKLSEARMV